MVELSRTFLNRPLSRQPGTATLVGVPQQVRLPDDSGLIAQAGAQFARGLQATSQLFSQIAERDRQLKRADDTAKTNQAIGDFQLGMAPIMQNIEQENVPHLERPEALKMRGQELIDGLIANVPQRFQTTFKAEATQQLARFVLREQSNASNQFVNEQKANIPALLSLKSRELVSADEKELPALEQAMKVTANSYVTSGIITQPLADALVQESFDRAYTERAERALIAQPERMLTHLQDLAAGGKGRPGMPIPPDKELFGLVRKAEAQVAQDIARFESDERRASQQHKQAQDAERIRLQNKLYTLDISMDDVRKAGDDIRHAGNNRLLSPEDHAVLLREQQSVEKALLEGPQVTSPGVKARIITQLYGAEVGGRGLDSLKSDIMQGLTDGTVNLKDAQSWLQEIGRRRQDNYSTVPAYKEGREFLDTTVNYLNKISVLPGMDRLEVEKLQQRSAYALQAYSEQVRQVWEREGSRGVENQAATIAREVQGLFGVTPREVLDYFAEPEVLKQIPRGDSVDERYTQAYQRLQASQLPDKEKAQQYQLLRQRQVLETQVERSETSAAPKPTSERQEREQRERQQRQLREIEQQKKGREERKKTQEGFIEEQKKQ